LRLLLLRMQRLLLSLLPLWQTRFSTPAWKMQRMERRCSREFCPDAAV
jgi:hypothetical protein